MIIKMEELHPLLPDDRLEYFTVLDNDSIYQYRLSTQSKSNVSSELLLKNVIATNRTAVNDKSEELLKLVKNAGQSYHTAISWKSNLSICVDPLTLFEQSLPSCNICTQGISSLTGLEQIQKNKCTCDINIHEVNTLSQNEVQTNMNARTVKNLNSECSDTESKSIEDRQLFRPKFGPKIPTRNRQTTSKCSPTYQDMDMENTRAYKSNLNKISFKTAKEQLLLSNPAAKRSLGTSRKAQSKFVSPMIGAQEKQEICDPEVTDERLKHIDPKMIELIESEIIDRGTPIVWDDIAGLSMAKSVIQEAVVWPLLRPDIFTGLRRPPKGILLFGPPGTGKTLIGKCIAAQCNATFFSISASSLTSKWIGDGEKMVRALFAVARCRQPAVVFIDEIDSLLTQRNDTEHEATRRIKTEFLVQFDGAGTGEEDRLLIVGATNRPQELDEAARRRLVKRLYIPLPDIDARKQIISNLLKNERNELSSAQAAEIARLTEGYSGADMKSLCSEAAMGPVRAVPLSQIITIDTEKVRPVNIEDFINALQRVRPSVSQDDLGQYVKWNQTYGQGF